MSSPSTLPRLFYHIIKHLLAKLLLHKSPMLQTKSNECVRRLCQEWRAGPTSGEVPGNKRCPLGSHQSAALPGRSVFKLMGAEFPQLLLKQDPKLPRLLPEGFTAEHTEFQHLPWKTHTMLNAFSSGFSSLLRF